MHESGCALVTGGSRGIGAACAVRLARAGWPVAGTVRILVNNAGVRADRLTVRMSEGDWLTVLNTNLFSAFLTCNRALMPMVRSRFGRIVNVSSVVGPNIGNPGQVNYGAAKRASPAAWRVRWHERASPSTRLRPDSSGFLASEDRMSKDYLSLRGLPVLHGLDKVKLLQGKQ